MGLVQKISVDHRFDTLEIDFSKSTKDFSKSTSFQQNRHFTIIVCKIPPYIEKILIRYILQRVRDI